MEDPKMTATLCTPMALRGLTLRNRIVISPMCQYSAQGGIANDWHLAHYGRLAMGGAGLVLFEATSISPEGRISPGDLGLWEDAQIAPMARVAAFVKSQGAAAGVQLAHAGRRAASQRPWHGAGPLGPEDADLRGEPAWPVVAPSALAMAEGWPVPQALSLEGIAQVRADFAAAARRALAAGFDVIEIHAAHGYLLHEFLSPLSNTRDDAYGGDRARRMRLALEVAADLRAIWPADRPVFVRVSVVDGADGGQTVEDTVAFARELKALGVDVVDCSTGGMLGSATASRVPRGPGFQLPYARAVREGAGIPAMAVGLILDPHQAEAALTEGDADLIAIGRTALDDPNWPLHAERALTGDRWDHWPPQAGWWLERRAASLRR